MKKNTDRRKNGKVTEAALTGSMRDYRVIEGNDLVERCDKFFQWQDTRRQCATWPFSRSTEQGPAATCAVRGDDGKMNSGVNFASQDYLSLSSHPAIAQAAHEAIEGFGVHSAGSPALVGNISTSVALEKKIAAFLKMEEAILYPKVGRPALG